MVDPGPSADIATPTFGPCTLQPSRDRSLDGVPSYSHQVLSNPGTLLTCQVGNSGVFRPEMCLGSSPPSKLHLALQDSKVPLHLKCCRFFVFRSVEKSITLARLLPMGLPEDVTVIAWGIGCESRLDLIDGY